MLLIKERKSVAATAGAVGVSPDHLRVLLKPVTTISPGALRRAVTLHDRLVRWRRQIPPAFGSPWYREQRAAWARTERELQRLLRPIPSNSPLRKWADAALELAQRPDYREKPHRERLREARLRESRRHSEQLQRLIIDALGRMDGSAKEKRPGYEPVLSG
jgi:hypothetical protein